MNFIELEKNYVTTYQLAHLVGADENTLKKLIHILPKPQIQITEFGQLSFYSRQVIPFVRQTISLFNAVGEQEAQSLMKEDYIFRYEYHYGLERGFLAEASYSLFMDGKRSLEF